MSRRLDRRRGIGDRARRQKDSVDRRGLLLQSSAFRQKLRGGYQDCEEKRRQSVLITLTKYMVSCEECDGENKIGFGKREVSHKLIFQPIPSQA
jgi:hypothetical protein